MLALKEFATFITLHMANLAATYTRLLAEKGQGYETFQADSRTTSARKVLEAVIDACQTETSAPLYNLFDETGNAPARWLDKNIKPPQPLLEVECLGETLMPVVTNLDASKFLWQILSETRAGILQAQGGLASPVSPPSPETKENFIAGQQQPDNSSPVSGETPSSHL